MIQKVLKTAALTSAGLPAFLTSVMLSTLSQTFSEKISSAERLDEIIKEESEKLRISVKVKGKLHDKYAANTTYLGEDIVSALMARINNEPYMVLNAGGFAAKRAIVKHELYHIKCDHRRGNPEDNTDSFFNYVFKEEPQAVLYSLGIKI
jgi:hypothetical protein